MTAERLTLYDLILRRPCCSNPGIIHICSIASQPLHSPMKRTKAAIVSDITRCQDEMDRLVEEMVIPFDKFFNDNDQSQQSVIGEKRAAFLAAEKRMEDLESELGSSTE